MKTAAFALATVMALSGTAFAGENVHVKHVKPAACVEASVKLDCAATGSIDKDHKLTDTGAASNGKKLGIDVNPWIFPSTF